MINILNFLFIGTHWKYHISIFQITESKNINYDTYNFEKLCEIVNFRPFLMKFSAIRQELIVETQTTACASLQ